MHDIIYRSVENKIWIKNLSLYFAMQDLISKGQIRSFCANPLCFDLFICLRPCDCFFSNKTCLLLFHYMWFSCSTQRLGIRLSISSPALYRSLDQMSKSNIFSLIVYAKHLYVTFGPNAKQAWLCICISWKAPLTAPCIEIYLSSTYNKI